MKHIHKTNVKDSLLFLSICRNTLSEMYEDKDLKYFIQNEATDYQIISLIVNNKIPVEKYNLEKEYQQWNKLQKIVIESSIYKPLKSIFFEIGPVIQYNLSSNRIILEFLLEADNDQETYVQGLYNKMKDGMKNSREIMSKGVTAAADVTADIASNPVSKIAVGATAGAAASIIVFAAAKLYQNYLSKAAKACKGRPDKVDCMKQYKDKALNMRIEKLRSGISVCNKAKNPDACKQSLQKRIAKLQTKVDRV